MKEEREERERERESGGNSDSTGRDKPPSPLLPLLLPLSEEQGVRFEGGEERESGFMSLVDS